MDDAELQRRLKKSLHVVSKLKKKEIFEQEVNKELAKRNEALKRQLHAYELQFQEVSKSTVKIDDSLDHLSRCSDLGNAEHLNHMLAVVKEEWEAFKSKLHQRSSPIVEDAVQPADDLPPSARPKSKKRSSMFVKVPELVSSFHVRRSTESNGEDMVANSSHEVASNSPRFSSPLTSTTPPFIAESAVERPLPAAAARSAAAFLFDVDFNDHKDDTMPVASSVPLFEHFVIVGASPESANELALQVLAYENDSLSSRLKKTLGGLLSTPIMLGRNNSSSSMAIAPETPKRVSQASQVEGDVSPSKQDLYPLLPLMGQLGERGRTKSMEDVPPEEAAPPGTRTLLSLFGARQPSKADKRGLKIDQSAIEDLPQRGDCSSAEFDSIVNTVAEQEEKCCETLPDDQKAPSQFQSKVDVTIASASGKVVADLVQAGAAFSRFSSNMFSKLSKPNAYVGPTVSSSTATVSLSHVESSMMNRSFSSEENASQDSPCSEVSSSMQSSPILAPLSMPSEQHVPPIADLDFLSSVPPLANPVEEAHLVHCDKRNGSATSAAQIIYHFPPDVPLPPQEVCDFCLPLGGKLQKLSGHKEEDSMVKEILFGHTHSKRNERCYVFLLEDKTVEAEGADEETGVGVSKLYAVCVAFPRIVRVAAPANAAIPASQGGGVPLGSLDFESTVCYAFLTRFPLFDLFFQLIFDLISCERLQRMESVAAVQDLDFRASRQAYEFNHTLRFTLYAGIQPVEHFRPAPLGDMPEYSTRAADWCLPPFLLYLPPDLIVWALSLLLCEAKLLVVGHEVGMVSCVVTGLLLLMRPLEWVSPVIPLLPIKMTDFIESPVPILAGIILDNDAQAQKGIDIHKILHIASQDDAILTAVLDVSAKELYLPASFASSVPTLCLPDADVLTSRLSAYSSVTSGVHSVGGGFVSNVVKTARHKGLFSLSDQQRETARCMHEVIASHVAAIAGLAVETFNAHWKETHACRNEVEVDGWKVATDADELPPLTPGGLDSERGVELDRDGDANADALLDLYSKIISDADAHTTAAVTTVTAPVQRTISRFPYPNTTPQYQSPSVISLHREMFVDADEDEFMLRFVKTQILSEHVGGLEGCGR